MRGVLKRVPGFSQGFRLAKRMTEVARRNIAQPTTFNSSISQLVLLSEYRNIFAGYYDHSPFKPGYESLMLVHVTSHPAWRHPTPKVPVRIHLFDWEKGVILEELGESFGWNWQQGARALWLDEDTVIFNVYDTETD